MEYMCNLLLKLCYHIEYHLICIFVNINRYHIKTYLGFLVNMMFI